ncbi:unnamed protein product, partial [Allacma fusca]
MTPECFTIPPLQFAKPISKFLCRRYRLTDTGREKRSETQPTCALSSPLLQIQPRPCRHHSLRDK